MTSLPISALGMLAVLVFALANVKTPAFLNLHSVVLVVGGTVFVLGLSNPWSEIGALFRALWQMVRPDYTVKEVNAHLVRLNTDRAAPPSGYHHPLIAYAQSLWEQGVDSDMFAILLNQKLEELVHSNERAIATLRNLAKYPPALGMTGTVLGLVSLFSGLNPESKMDLGPNLALAMTATFYGLVLANGLLMPLADRLYVQHLRQSRDEDHVFKTLMLIQRGTADSILQEAFGAKAA